MFPKDATVTPIRGVGRHGLKSSSVVTWLSCRLLKQAARSLVSLRLIMKSLRAGKILVVKIPGIPPVYDFV